MKQQYGYVTFDVLDFIKLAEKCLDMREKRRFNLRQETIDTILTKKTFVTNMPKYTVKEAEKLVENNWEYSHWKDYGIAWDNRIKELLEAAKFCEKTHSSEKITVSAEIVSLLGKKYED